MNGKPFDAMGRAFARRLTRRRVLGLAVEAAVLPVTAGRAQTDAPALVRRFYELVDAYQYEQAYGLLGAKWHSQQSLANFTNGYGDTAFVQCTTTGETASGDTTRVGVKLVAWHNDGGIVGYTGAYTVGSENGRLTILAGNNTFMPVPSGTPPLCTMADLDLAFGPWQGAAGSREGSVVATNRGAATCALGGSPRITLTDTAGAVLVSTSEEGSSPEAVILHPGEQAQAPLRFSNWCGRTATARAEIPGDTAVGHVSDDAYGIAYPPCNGPGQAAVMGVKGWTHPPA